MNCPYSEKVYFVAHIDKVMRLRNTRVMKKMRAILKLLMERDRDNPYDVQRKSGVGQTTTFRFLEGSISSPTYSTVRKWARAYGVTESQLRGESPIDGVNVPDDPVELKDILPPEELKLLSNIKRMKPEARGAVIGLAEMLAQNPDALYECEGGGDRRKSVVSEKNQHLRAGDRVHFSQPQQYLIEEQKIAPRTGTRA